MQGLSSEGAVLSGPPWSSIQADPQAFDDLYHVWHGQATEFLSAKGSNLGDNQSQDHYVRGDP
jgi:hypothetical protein